VETLRGRGLRLCVASSARPDELHALLEVAGVPWLAPRATSGEEVARSKPAPDIVEAALAEIDVPANEAALIGDTPYDVAAGERAGVTVIGLRTGGWDEAGLRGATAVYRDPADLLAHIDDSPLRTA
jgi:beta-phosphoglucomutase-like phosphatase (HAD superfamily)